MFSIDNIIAESRKRITRNQRFELKESLDHGKSILQTEAQLAAYLDWYGEMHKVKCHVASQNFPYQELGMRIHIVDWGCGQAVASLCFLDALDQRGLLSYVRKITLIEPSSVAISQAKKNIAQAMIGHAVEIECINKKLPSYTGQEEPLGLILNGTTTVHLFSNILDIVDVNLRKTAELIEGGKGTHFVLCMGPCNGNKNRIDDFCGYFTDKIEFSNVEDRCIAHTSDTYYPITCKTRCFYIQTGKSHVDTSYTEGQYDDAGTYDDYDISGLIRNGLVTEKLLRVYNHISKNLSIYDKVFLKPEMGGDSPDLIIVRKGKGIVVMNVFEHDLATCMYDGDKGFKCRDEVIGSPFSEVIGYCASILTDKSSMLLRNAILRKNGWYVVRPAVWFPDASQDQIESVFNTDNEKSKVLRLSAEDFDRNILDVLDLRKSRSSFTEEAYDEFISMLRSKWHTFRDGDQSLRLWQEQAPLAVSEERKKQKIKGVAGAGKTQVLASRAVNCLLRTGGNVLILTYNITLINYIRYRIDKVPADFLWSKFTISNYHSFFKSQARNYHIKMSDGSFENEAFFEPKKNSLQKYSAILIDEVQDYEYSWLKILKDYFLAEDGEFVVFGDAKQNIYLRGLDNEKEIKTPIAGRWTRLNHGHRFDNPRIASVAMDFQKYFFHDQPTDIILPQLELGFTSKRDVEYYSYPVNTPQIEVANACNQLILNNNLKKGQTVIVSQTYPVLRCIEQQFRVNFGCQCKTTFETQEVFNKLLVEHDGNKNSPLFRRDIKQVRRNKKLQFTMDTEELKISSIHSYKGWDAENVILIIQPNSDLDEFGGFNTWDLPSLIYTAITRAKQNLFVLNMGNNQFDGFFRAALGQ